MIQCCRISYTEIIIGQWIVSMRPRYFYLKYLWNWAMWKSVWPGRTDLDICVFQYADQQWRMILSRKPLSPLRFVWWGHFRKWKYTLTFKHTQAFKLLSVLPQCICVVEMFPSLCLCRAFQQKLKAWGISVRTILLVSFDFQLVIWNMFFPL